MKEDKKYSILVNTTDVFEPCWKPFFQLFKYYWPDYNGNIYLNTENKDFTYDGCNIIPLKNAMSQDVKKWSDRLLSALDAIESDIIVYMQDDYFLNGFVQTKEIEKCVRLMRNHSIAYINLTHFATKYPSHAPNNQYVWSLDNGMQYRVSLQASLWNIPRMRKFIVNGETPWNFEKKVVARTDASSDTFYCVNRNMYNSNNTIIPYVATGVLKGKWNTVKIKDLFDRHNIRVNYYVRLS